MYEHLQALSYSLSHEFEEWRTCNENREIVAQAEYLVSILSHLANDQASMGTFDLHMQAAMADAPAEPMFEIMRLCREKLIDFITGAVSGVQIIFKDGDMNLWNRLQRQSEFIKHYSQLAADMLKQMNVSKARVVEVGGGTGATTQRVMEWADSTTFESYTFTDVSAAFIAQARALYGRRNEFDQRTLDINRDLSTQGFCDSSVDVVIAVNVLHVADDPFVSLQRLARLLRHRGKIILSEGAPEPDGRVWAAEPIFAFLPQWARHPSRRAARSGFYEWKYWEQAARNAGLEVCDQYLASHWYSDELRGGVVALEKAK